MRPRHPHSALGSLDLAGIDFDAFTTHPLDGDTLRCLRYMHDVEHHTVCYLRDILVTRAHRDPELTAFLSMWVYEEFWHGEAIARVLAAHGDPPDPRIGAREAFVTGCQKPGAGGLGRSEGEQDRCSTSVDEWRW
jgi:hypothetical protein